MRCLPLDISTPVLLQSVEWQAVWLACREFVARRLAHAFIPGSRVLQLRRRTIVERWIVWFAIDSPVGPLAPRARVVIFDTPHDGLVPNAARDFDSAVVGVPELHLLVDWRAASKRLCRLFVARHPDHAVHHRD